MPHSIFQSNQKKKQKQKKNHPIIKYTKREKTIFHNPKKKASFQFSLLFFLNIQKKKSKTKFSQGLYYNITLSLA